MIAYCTYCSAEKKYSENPQSAIDLYKSERISKVFEEAAAKDVRFVILSGKFGLVEPHQKIEHYDHLLNAYEVADHSHLIASQLKDKNITRIVFFTVSIKQDKNIKPYIDCMIAASAQSGIPIEFTEIDYCD